MFPLSQLVQCPLIGFFAVAGRTRVRDTVLFGQDRGNEFKGVASDICCAYCPRDWRHVAGDTLTAFRIYSVPSMVCDRFSWPRLELWLVTGQTQIRSGHDEVSFEVGAVSVMAT